MANIPETFEVNYNGKVATIEVHHPAGETIYRVIIAAMQPLILNRAKGSSGVFFWTSIPQGKQKLAEEIGALIEEHIKSNS